MKLHPEVQALSDVMRELERLLRDHEQPAWADAVASSLRSIDSADAYGLQSFLAMFGGMGSLNDLVLSGDGVPLRAENDRLQVLAENGWKIANRLQKEARQA